ncbi:MAG: 5-bromo-4-chloroindolyl phosphate hydrolysis family protein [Spirochaetes bacterium]|nr:5-bromo-4-chloroindolyl phosphate hydrolysis family protein [Spirochaetota bacterium]
MAEQKLKNRVRSFVTIIGGVAFFIVLKTVLAYGTFLSMILALLVFIALRIVWPKKKKESSEKSEVANDTGINPREAQRIIDECADKVREIRAMTIRIRNNAVAEEVRGIARAAMNIIDNFRKDPKDIKRARQFINYYLDATVKIVTRYVELSNSSSITPEIEKSLKKVEDIMHTVRHTFEKQYEMLLQDDLLDLDTEVEVLKKTMKLEGM